MHQNSVYQKQEERAKAYGEVIALWASQHLELASRCSRTGVIASFRALEPFFSR